ncbi:Phosphoserine phosphatase [hydrothermal vent metagenome]|uniref:Phosphoserine phosphatase n=1 Tax=hydrothermal vent metagenome TaxID=652676 RepID=A0A3B0Z6Q1_9ZZZZ
MSIAIFDLDNTLLGGDSDALWGSFISEQGIVDAEFYAKENQRFYDEYQAGKLDIYEFLNFSLKPLSEHSLATLNRLHQQFMQEKIAPIMLPAAKKLLKTHRDQGHLLMIITATNRFVTAPIAKLFEVDVLIATDPEIINNRYSGKVAGTPCFQGGKVERLNQWLKENNRTLGESWFYSDSQNDLPLLEMVNHPVAVDPDPSLAAHAAQRGWPLITLRQGGESQAFQRVLNKP